MRQRKDESVEAFAARRAESDRARRSTPEGAAKNRATVAAWRDDNPERKRAADATWRAQNPEAMKAARAAWKARNRDRLRAYKQKRRKAATGSLSGDIVVRLLRLQRGRCAYCTTPIAEQSHIDHIDPIARGGKNVDDNVQLLCPPCNTRKGARDPFEFANSQGRLL